MTSAFLFSKLLAAAIGDRKERQRFSRLAANSAHIL